MGFVMYPNIYCCWCAKALRWMVESSGIGFIESGAFRLGGTETDFYLCEVCYYFMECRDDM